MDINELPNETSEPGLGVPELSWKTLKINQYELKRFSELFVKRNLEESRSVDRIVNVSLFEHQLLRQFTEAQHIIGEITGPASL